MRENRWAFRIALWALALVLAVSAWQGVLTVVRGSLTTAGTATPDDIQTGAILLSALTLVLVGVSEARVQADLAAERRTRQAGLAEAVARKAAGGPVRSALAVGAARRSRDLFDVLAPAVAAVTAIVAAGWVYETAWSWYAQMGVAAVLGTATGMAIVRRASAAAKQVAPTLLDAVRSPRALITLAVAGTLAGWGWTALVTQLGGRIEPPAVLTAGLIGGAIAAAAVGMGDMTRRAQALAQLEGQLAAVLGVTEKTILELRVRIDARRHTIKVFPPLPAGVLVKLADLEARTAQFLPEYRVLTADPAGGVLLVPVDTETQARREIMAASDGLVTAIREIAGGLPGEQEWTLSPAVSPAWGARIDAVARQRGATLVRWTPYDRAATVAVLDPLTTDVRARVAGLVRCDPWDLELTTVPGDTHPLASVTITRMPAYTGDRARLWRDIVIPALPGGNPGWGVEDRPAEGQTRLTWAETPVLPARVDLADVLPAQLAPEAWSRIPLGVGVDGAQVEVDLAAGPHTLVVGPTGSGKTVALVALVAQAVARGHEVVMIDPTKAGLDFAALRPFMTAWADDYPTARAAMEAVYEEVGRRKAVLRREVAVKWSDLSADVRQREGIRPLIVLLDEYGSLALDATVPKGLDKSDPLVTQAVALNASKAVVKELVGRVAREARFVGIHLMIALQRPDVAVMGSGELRSNLTSAIQLVPPGRGISGDALRMVFSGDVVDAAAETIRVLDDGTSRGLAVMAAEGGSARGVRVAYAPMAAIPPLLDQLGVPRIAAPWNLTAPASGTPPVEGRVIEESATALPEVDLSALAQPADDWGW